VGRTHIGGVAVQVQYHEGFILNWQETPSFSYGGPIRGMIRAKECQSPFYTLPSRGRT